MPAPYTNPTGGQFIAQFQGDFPYTNDAGTLTGVNNTDINTALLLMSYNINQGLFPDQTAYTLYSLYLAAHYLVLNIRQRTQGWTGNYPWMESSKGVGPASQSFALPEELTKNPSYAHLGKTYYGVQYFMFVYPFLKANCFALFSRTNA
jgi:hypothetical protein